MREDPVGPTLLRLTVPMIMGIISIMLINIIDTLYIGQLGVAELAAISFTFPIVFSVMSVAFGIGIGTSAVVARAIGAGNRAQVQQLTTHSLLLTLVIMAGVSVIGLTTIEPIFTFLGADNELLPIIDDYMIVWYCGVSLVAIPIVGNNAIRAAGDSKTPSLVMMVVAAVNAVLDPFLIFGIGPFPEMGVKGAAFATVFAYACALCAGLWILGAKEGMLSTKFLKIRHVWGSWQRITYIAFPATITNILAPISAALLTKIISLYGQDAVAGFGVGTRLEGLAIIGIMALSTILTPFIGQNFGAKDFFRIDKAISYSNKFAIVWGLSACILLALSAKLVSPLFSASQAVQSVITLFLWITPVSFAFYGLVILAAAAYNGINRPMQSATISIVRLFILMIPLAWLGSRWWGLNGIFIGIAVANIIGGLLAAWSIRRYISNYRDRLL
ncbi:MAG: MATE family efflux transporter [Acidiferrobacteraceae bacterium]|nr:MATE family efflux transporter [Acidiferrobacteraceae bacterium]|tara:strand:+ start:590 stop:1921 length:1332 start_codon:yes stop_codon:yes gene_type:complete